MKKTLLTILLMVFSVSYSFAQDQAKNEAPESKSKAANFLKADGAFLLKEFYALQAIKGVECEVFVMTDIITGQKMGCLRLIKKYSSSYSEDTYIGLLDSDELDDCIRCMEYIKNTLLPSTPEVYTEVEYKTNDGVKLGAYFTSKKEWRAFIYTEGYTSRSAAFLAPEDIDSFINVFKQAKLLIQEKTK